MKYIKIIVIILLLIISTFIYMLINNKNPYEKYNIKNYQYNQSIIKIKDKVATLAPLNYDGDAKDEFKDKIFELELDDNVSYYHFDIKSTLKNEKKKSKYKYTKVNEKEAIEEINTNGVSAYIWTNNNKIYKIVIYGETIIQK